MRYKEFYSTKKQGVVEGSESELSQLNADIANVLNQPEFGGRAWLNGGSYSYMVDIKQPNKMKASDGSVITVKRWAHGLKDYASKWVLDAFLENYPEEWSGSLIYPVKSIQGQSDHEIRRLRGDIMEGSVSKKKKS